MKALTPEEFVPMWMENHRIGPGAAAQHEIVQMLKDFMTDIDSPIRLLVNKIYQDPQIPKNPVLLAGLSDTKQMAFKNGFYSIRDTEEFQRVAKLTKLK
jgi:hypothetical protein